MLASKLSAWMQRNQRKQKRLSILKILVKMKQHKIIAFALFPRFSHKPNVEKENTSTKLVNLGSRLTTNR